ncbi:MAG: hypothetical protein H6566_16450 [Lewinellaceae bacterium]|nr:hypothetical protein [Lewinellaceae bacterium]
MYHYKFRIPLPHFEYRPITAIFERAAGNVWQLVFSPAEAEAGVVYMVKDDSNLALQTFAAGAGGKKTPLAMG